MTEPQPASPRFQVSIVNAILGVIALSLFGPAVVSTIKRWGAPASFEPAGPADAYFMVGCVAAILTILRLCKLNWVGLLAWLVVSLPLAILGTFVAFGNATVSWSGGCPPGFTGFCGQGVPAPGIIWDGGADYPSPAGLFLNWPFLFIVGSLLFILFRYAVILFGKLHAVYGGKI